MHIALYILAYLAFGLGFAKWFKNVIYDRPDLSFWFDLLLWPLCLFLMFLAGYWLLFREWQDRH